MGSVTNFVTTWCAPSAVIIIELESNVFKFNAATKASQPFPNSEQSAPESNKPTILILLISISTCGLGSSSKLNKMLLSCESVEPVFEHLASSTGLRSLNSRFRFPFDLDIADNFGMCNRSYHIYSRIICVQNYNY